SLGCHVWFGHLSATGYVTGSIFAEYPHLTPAQVTDWAKFTTTLTSAGNAASVRPEWANFWQHLPETARKAFIQLPANPSPDVKTGVCDAINNALLHPALFVAASPPASGIPTASEAKARVERNRAV